MATIRALEQDRAALVEAAAQIKAAVQLWTAVSRRAGTSAILGHAD